MFLNLLLFEKALKYYYVVILIACSNLIFAQIDTSVSVTFDFNEHLIKEAKKSAVTPLRVL